MASIVSAVIAIGRLLFDQYSTIKSFICFKSSLRALEKKKTSLLDLRNRVFEDVDSSDTKITKWLRKVEKIRLEVDSVQAGMTANNQTLCGCYFDCCKRCRLSKEIARMLKDVKRLLKEGNIDAKMVGRNYLARPVERIPVPCIGNQTTASKILARVIDLLNDNDVKRIGVWGMGGVGKTTLVKNLNNKFKDSSSTFPFSIIILANVSQKQDLRKVQIQIAERLNLEVKVEESEESIAKRLYWKLWEKRFLLILDDVWETIDLDSLGVPQFEQNVASKILLTSRSFEVCRKMKTDKQVKVEILNDEESWLLFNENAGKVATLEHIEPTAREVAKECGGLPLAIITVGKAMREKARLELWKDALSELQRSDVPDIEGIQNTVFKPLKLSYDSLQGKNTKPCFLYCSLYPEDFSIDASELIKCWLGEGLIDGQKNYEDSYNRGIALIENLKDSCLLEDGAREGTVKMHDIVRNVAIWISSSLEDGCKALVRSGIGLPQISKSEISAALKRISFMHNKIKELPDSGIHCPMSSTLLLQDNHDLKSIPEGFLQAFQSLKVLNISGTGIQSLPQSIVQLVGLLVLILKDCVNLEKIPQVGELGELQVLDCSASGVKVLPSEMKNLKKLRQLYLSRAHKLTTIEGGIISALSSLEVLDMTFTAYIWDQQAAFNELLPLQHLLVISIQLKGIPTLDSTGHTWIDRVRRYQFVIGQGQTTFRQTELDGKTVIIMDRGLLGVHTNPLLSNATSLVIDHYLELDTVLLTMAVESNYCFAGLKSLTIANSEVFGSSDASTSDSSSNTASKLDLLPNLQKLHLINVKHLESISQLIHTLGVTLSRLQAMEVTNCPNLKYLLRYDNPKLHTGKLEVIKVSFCEGLLELFQHTPGEIEAAVSVVPILRIIEVTSCYAIRKLPLRDLNPNTIQKIRAEESWWHTLERDNNDTKVHLQRFFIPVRDADF